MWLNQFEEKIMTDFYKNVIRSSYKQFIFELNDGAILKVVFEIEAESDNGKEDDEGGYEEYRESYFKIVEIIKDDTNSYKKDQFIAINYHCLPNSYKPCN